MTVPELLIVAALLALTVLLAGMYSLSYLNAEEARSAVYQTQMLLGLARTEAVTRNRACRFEIEGSERRIRVWDLNDPSVATDDIRLADVQISPKVVFQDPEGNTPITLQSLSGQLYGATFGADGSVSAGAGVVTLRAMDRFERVSLFGAGGTKVERWSGTGWQAGG